MQYIQLDTLEKPYYIEYKLTLRNSNLVKSESGNLVESKTLENASLTVGVRVGDYKLDNTNFFDFGLSFFGSGDEEEKFKNRLVPIEMDYNSLRRELWLSTDAAYKQVAETYTKKLTTLKSRIRKDTTHDFLVVNPEKNYIEDVIPPFDKPYFENLTKELSAVFNAYPEIHVSTVGVEYLPETVIYVNSEGMEYIKNEFYTGLEIVAATQAEDGMPLSNFYSAFSRNPSVLPDKDSLLNAALLVAETLKAQVNAPVMDEPYSGPVLFEGAAAAQLFAQIFVPNLAAQRQQLTDNGIQDNERYTAFQNKIGGRVLPEFFDVEASPLKVWFDDTPLMGYYKLDDDGIKPQEVNLVEKGYLRNLLSSRVPTKRVRKSNGHQRGGAPMYSNIFVHADKEHTLSNDELKQQMMKLCKDRELPYGLVVRKTMDQNIMFTTLFRITKGAFITGQMQNKVPLIEVYRIYPDGREEPVRGTEAKGFTHQSFKDIINVGDRQYALNLLAPAVTSPFVSGGDQYVVSSVIVGDILFEDGEISPVESDFPKPPILASPGK